MLPAQNCPLHEMFIFGIEWNHHYPLPHITEYIVFPPNENIIFFNRLCFYKNNLSTMEIIEKVEKNHLQPYFPTRMHVSLNTYKKNFIFF